MCISCWRHVGVHRRSVSGGHMWTGEGLKTWLSCEHHKWMNTRNNFFGRTRVESKGSDSTARLNQGQQNHFSSESGIDCYPVQRWWVSWCPWGHRSDTRRRLPRLRHDTFRCWQPESSCRAESKHQRSSFIRSGHFYSASSSPLLLRGTHDYSIVTVLELTWRSTTGNCE